MILIFDMRDTMHVYNENDLSAGLNYDLIPHYISLSIYQVDDQVEFNCLLYHS